MLQTMTCEIHHWDFSIFIGDWTCESNTAIAGFLVSD